MRKLLALVLLLHLVQAMEREGTNKQKTVLPFLSNSINTDIDDLTLPENITSITITENFDCQLFCFYLPSPSMRREGY